MELIFIKESCNHLRSRLFMQILRWQHLQAFTFFTTSMNRSVLVNIYVSFEK